MRLWIAGVLVVAAVAIAVIAVIAVDSDDAGQPVAPPGPPEAAAMQEFQECMEENGAPLPESPGGAVMIEPGETTREALEQCQALMPAPGSSTEPGFSPPLEN